MKNSRFLVALFTVLDSGEVIEGIELVSPDIALLRKAWPVLDPEVNYVKFLENSNRRTTPYVKNLRKDKAIVEAKQHRQKYAYLENSHWIRVGNDYALFRNLLLETVVGEADYVIGKGLDIQFLYLYREPTRISTCFRAANEGGLVIKLANSSTEQKKNVIRENEGEMLVYLEPSQQLVIRFLDQSSPVILQNDGGQLSIHKTAKE